MRWRRKGHFTVSLSHFSVAVCCFLDIVKACYHFLVCVIGQSARTSFDLSAKSLPRPDVYYSGFAPFVRLIQVLPPTMGALSSNQDIVTKTLKQRPLWYHNKVQPASWRLFPSSFLRTLLSIRVSVVCILTQSLYNEYNFYLNIYFSVASAYDVLCSGAALTFLNAEHVLWGSVLGFECKVLNHS